jgi:hypothetical protein
MSQSTSTTTTTTTASTAPTTAVVVAPTAAPVAVAVVAPTAVVPVAATVVAPTAVVGASAPFDTKKYANQVYNDLKTSLGTGAVTVASVINLITTGMEEVEKFVVLSGPQKKELVLYAINDILNELPFSQADLAMIKSAFTLFGSSIIDTIAAASKGQIKINTGAIAAAAATGATAAGTTAGTTAAADTTGVATTGKCCVVL